MRFTSLHLENWKNFLQANVELRKRVFIVGPNASGKSNLLDAFRFLRDVADPQGGFQRAVRLRGGASQIRSLHARRYPNVAVEVGIDLDDSAVWSYRLEFSQDNQRRPIVKKELVKKNNKIVMERPDNEDAKDDALLSQTHLEQVSRNKDFRGIAEFLSSVRYQHIVPQLIREPDRSIGRVRDPFGGDFLEQLASTPTKTQTSRLKRIALALQIAVPQLEDLKLERDLKGVPHLRGLYKHWRPNAGWQSEDQFSDGTLRILGLLWSLLDGGAPLLLEEPELSLHSAVVRVLPSMFARVGRRASRQILLSTHSADLLTDVGISPEEVLLIVPAPEGSAVEVAAQSRQIRALLQGGSSMAEAVMPRTAPKGVDQLTMFGD